MKNLYRGHKVELELELGNQAPLDNKALNIETGNDWYDNTQGCRCCVQVDHIETY